MSDKPLRFYVVSVYGPRSGAEEEWFTECRKREGAPDGTYGCSGPVLGYTVIGVPEDYTGPHGLCQGWVYPTAEVAAEVARRRRAWAVARARKRAAAKAERKRGK